MSLEYSPDKEEKWKLRVCIDFHELNATMPKDEYEMPMANMLVDSTSRNEIIS